MIVLAIESATIEVAVAAIGPQGLLALDRQRPGRSHAESLHPAIARVLERSGVSLGEIGAIAVDVGPGLFTGLRVAVAAAKGLAVALRIGVVACTSTEVLANSVAPGDGALVPVVDLRRGDVAWQLSEDPEAIAFGPPGELAELLEGRGGAFRLVGDGALRHQQILCRSSAVRLVEGGEPLAPPVAVLADFGYPRAVAGTLGAPEPLEPRYLKAPDARVNFAVRPTAEGPLPLAKASPCR